MFDWGATGGYHGVIDQGRPGGVAGAKSTHTQRATMYTGQTEQPCCLCASPETTMRIDLPPRAVPLLKNAGPIAWRDIEGAVSLHFCESDWEQVRDITLETGMSPLGRCNVARASFVLREDFESYLSQTREEPDQRPLEQRLLSEATTVIEEYGASGALHTDRDLVEARLTKWALEDTDPELGVVD